MHKGAFNRRKYVIFVSDDMMITVYVPTVPPTVDT